MSNILTINLKGGLGNQLFQIAFLYSISKKLNIEYKLEKNQFDHCGQGSHPSKYYDSIYENLNFIDSLNINSKFSEKKWGYYLSIDEIKNIFKDKNNIILMLDGYFQSPKYFNEYKNEIKNLFTPKIGIISYIEKYTKFFDKFPELKNENDDFCFIGVRRGDYIKHYYEHNPCGMTYFNSAMNKMDKKKYFITSDDLEWVKQNFKGEKFVYLDLHLYSDLEIFLVSRLFKNYIISNSTFHWWAGYLSIYDNTRIIAPDKWLFGKDVNLEKYNCIYTDEMEIIERPIEI